VVTEYGIAELKGKSIYQRVMELAQIAHPKFREQLIDEAKKHHYIFSDQLPPHREDLIFLEGYKSTLCLSTGETIEFRPLLPSDEFAFRSFFYSLQAETVYYRYFYNRKLFSHSAIQEQWANVDYRKSMSLVGFVSRGGHKEMMSIGSYAAAEKEGFAEIALVVREDFQGHGLGSHLLRELEKIAKENSYKGFVADVLKENSRMIHVFRKRYPKSRSTFEHGEITLEMKFEKAASNESDKSP